MRPYSQMSRDELLLEIETLKQEKVRARRQSLFSELDVIQQKINFAKSYLVDKSTIQPHQFYQVEGEPIRFWVEDLNGIMAWGRYEGQHEQIALPIGILTLLPNEKNHCNT